MEQTAHLERHIAAAKAGLAQLAGLSARTAASERAIMEAAEHRLAAVNADLDKLRPRVSVDAGAADDYEALTLEFGRLQTIIGQALHHGAGSPA